jgi:hypothetical protein
MPEPFTFFGLGRLALLTRNPNSRSLEKNAMTSICFEAKHLGMDPFSNPPMGTIYTIKIDIALLRIFNILF